MEEPFRRWFLIAALIQTGCLNPSQTSPVTAGSPAAAEQTEQKTGKTGKTPQATIVVDQFGYLTQSEKIAVIRDPQKGFDAAESFTPGGTYAVVTKDGDKHAFTGAVKPWRGGAQDPSSGDKAWWFDFSPVTTPGEYYVLDIERKVRSPVFRIGDEVYREVLKHAVRAFFYQRAGFPKEAKYAGEGWADGASHVGPLQDHHCRLYRAPNDASTERDLYGGWYDAGDYNKYTSWHATYLIALLRAYQNQPKVFGDDFGIPESGNQLPDIVDEAKWGMDWLVRMQNANGSVLSVMGLASGSPPSTATGPSLYGSESTSATLGAAAAFAYGSTAFRRLGVPALVPYANDLLARAQRAWNWAVANPRVLFKNNDDASGTKGLASGQQEVDDYGRLSKRLAAATYLFEATQQPVYRDFIDKNCEQIHLMQWGFAYPFEMEQQRTLLCYAGLSGATPAVSSRIREVYARAMDGEHNFKAFYDSSDPYLAYIKDYTWGSNSVKSNQGNMFYDLITYGLAPQKKQDATRAAARYLHYLHGVNPLGLVYLSNMNGVGAERSVTAFFHSWFAHGSPKWDRVGVSTFGPPPGFLTGGPNPSYEWDGCCPSGCGSAENNAVCVSEPISPPKGQPAQKSYKDFNTSWPLNSWAVTENSNGYQVAYIELLSKFVK
ncbi:MAG TPA: glycoside hydrolase family 9 protein [Polyangiaceae bacterium]|jgi:hypothetical protein